MKGTTLLIKALLNEGVDTIFGYPGAALIPLFHEMVKESGIKFILPRHEQAGVHAADGYARTTGKPGVVIATSGPGATNLVTGIANAHMDSIPIIAITGQVKTNLIGNDAFQEVDLTGVTRSICKHNYLIKNPEELPHIIKEAFHIATTGRPGPVVIDLPVNITTADIKTPVQTEINLPTYRPITVGNPKQISKAAELINNAQAPLLYIGGGVIASGAETEIQELAEKGNIPVTSTLMALGAFSDTHPLSLKMLGMHGTAYANHATSNCDVLIAVGARFDDRVTGKLDEFATKAKIIHIDIDPTTVSKNVPVDIPIVGDAKNIVSALIKEIEERDRTEWLEQINAWKKEYPLRYSQDGLRPQYIIEKLCELTKDRDTIIATEVGQHQMWTCLFYNFTKSHTLVSSGGLGTMGFGLPAAMGAQIGKPDHLVVDIAGDGSIQMNIQELVTLKTHKLPVKILILNNSYLGMVRQWQELFFEKNYAFTDLYDNPDFVRIAEAYDIKGILLDKKEDTEKVLKEMIDYDGPVIVNAIVEREENVYPMVPAGEAIDRMIGGMA